MSVSTTEVPDMTKAHLTCRASGTPPASDPHGGRPQPGCARRSVLPSHRRRQRNGVVAIRRDGNVALMNEEAYRISAWSNERTTWDAR